MKLLLKREKYTEIYTKGKLYIDGVFECYTLEDREREGQEKIYGQTAIPKGTYKVVLSYSNRFKQIMPELKDVPNFVGVRIHKGNTSDDTDGCILVGANDVADKDFIANSKKAYDSLFSKLEQANDISIIIQ